VFIPAFIAGFTGITSAALSRSSAVEPTAVFLIRQQSGGSRRCSAVYREAMGLVNRCYGIDPDTPVSQRPVLSASNAACYCSPHCRTALGFYARDARLRTETTTIGTASRRCTLGLSGVVIAAACLRT
jgi:hypothetical protein